MAESIGVASGLLALITFTYQSSITLYDALKSFQSHPQRVRSLLEELAALTEVLRSLNEMVEGIPDIDFSALEVPLKRCGEACNDFRDKLSECLVHSGSNHSSFRDWAKLKYMGEDVTGFTQLLAGYKLTVSIALMDANLRKSSASAESIELCSKLLSDARVDLEDRLKMIDEKLESILDQNVAESEADSSEMLLIKEERLSTEKGLQICAQLADSISSIQLAAKRSTDRKGSHDSSITSERITHEGLQECKDSLARTALKLEGYERELVGRLLDKTKTTITSDDDRADLERLRNEWEATRQGMNMCLRAQDHLKDNISIIDNYATGDAVQFMVSTSEKTIHGKNKGTGWRTRQLGGHLSDESLQQVTRTFSTITLPMSRHETTSGASPTSSDDGAGQEPDSKLFKEQYGRGFKLSPKSGPNPPASSTGSADGRFNRPSRG